MFQLSENIKRGFKSKSSWNKYGPEITTQQKSNNLDYLIDPTFRNFNRLFAFSFEKVAMILQEILLVSIACHQQKSKTLMY